MSALAIFAAQRGLQTALEIKQARDAQVQAEFSAAAIERQMGEIQDRTKEQVNNIWAQAEKVSAIQQGAFISGGVELTGSALSVVSDTMNNAARAAYIRQRETDYEMIGLAFNKGQYEQMASDETLLLRIGAAGVNGVAGLMQDKYAYNRRSLRDAGTSGIGDDSGSAPSGRAYRGDSVAALGGSQ